jgi:hypothetical protein
MLDTFSADFFLAVIGCCEWRVTLGRVQLIQMGLSMLCTMPGKPSISSTVIDMEVAYRNARHLDER